MSCFGLFRWIDWAVSRFDCQSFQPVVYIYHTQTGPAPQAGPIPQHVPIPEIGRKYNVFSHKQGAVCRGFIRYLVKET